MTVSASDLKSEVKLDEKRETSIHKRKMLRFRSVNRFAPFHESKILLTKRIFRSYNCRWQRALIQLLLEYTLLNRHPPPGVVVT